MDQITEENNEIINMEHVADSALDNIQMGKVVQGEIVTIDSEFVYINVGIKSDGAIAIEEFDEKPEVGNMINVMLKNNRLVDGVYQFSKTAADSEKYWQDFIDYYNEGNLNIIGKIKSVTNKGKIIELNSKITGFLPFSLAADLKREIAADKDYEFKIIGVDIKKRSILLSRKDFLDDENKVNWEKFNQNFNVNDRVKGIPVKFVEFGAFVRVEGIDALLHRNDMSWKNVFKQRKLFKLNEEKEFLILDINRDENKISLGYKQLTEDPWSNIEDNYKIDECINGKVVTLINSGAFIDIGNDVEGFLKNSELTWTKNSLNAKDVLKKGQEVELKIININKEERKMMLSLKEMIENPWDSIDERFSLGSVHTKKIKKIVKFGFFVELENNIDGLVHISDITWNENNRNATESYKVNDEVEFKILDIDKKEMKIACGIKQMVKSPWESISEKYLPRTMVNGTISGITDFGLFVKLEEDVEGLVHISEVSTSRIEDLKEHFKIGDEVKAIVLGVDVQKKRLSLSIKHYDSISEKEALKKVLDNTSSGRVTIGDMIKLKLNDQK